MISGLGRPPYSFLLHTLIHCDCGHHFFLLLLSLISTCLFLSLAACLSDLESSGVSSVFLFLSIATIAFNFVDKKDLASAQSAIPSSSSSSCLPVYRFTSGFPQTSDFLCSDSFEFDIELEFNQLIFLILIKLTDHTTVEFNHEVSYSLFGTG